MVFPLLIEHICGVSDVFVSCVCVDDEVYGALQNCSPKSIINNGYFIISMIYCILESVFVNNLRKCLMILNSNK